MPRAPTSRRQRRALTPGRIVALALGCLILSGCSVSNNDASVEAPAELSSSSTAPPPTLPSNPEFAPPPSATSPVTGPTDSATLDDLTSLAGRIVRRSADGHILISSPDASNEVRVADRSEQQSTQPTWSTSGTQVAWSAVRPDGPLLLITNADGTNLRSTEVPTPAFYLSWSPNDSWLAGLRNGPAGIELIVVDPVDASIRVVGPGQPFFTDWSSADSIIAAIGGSALVDIPAITNEPTTERPLRSPLGVFQAPAVLPGGDVVVALRDGDQNVITRLAGISETRLGTASGPVVMALNHAGTKLAVFVAADETLSEVIRFQTTDVPELAPGQVSIIDLETGAVETRPEMQIGAINWSPDDATLAMLQFGDNSARWLFARDADVTSGVRFVPSRELASAYLPFSDQFQRSSTWWSPDSKAFVMAGAIGDEPGVWIDLIDDGKGPARIGGGDIAFWSPR